MIKTLAFALLLTASLAPLAARASSDAAWDQGRKAKVVAFAAPGTCGQAIVFALQNARIPNFRISPYNRVAERLNSPATECWSRDPKSIGSSGGSATRD